MEIESKKEEKLKGKEEMNKKRREIEQNTTLVHVCTKQSDWQT